jgi:hypothetical protein
MEVNSDFLIKNKLEKKLVLFLQQKLYFDWLTSLIFHIFHFLFVDSKEFLSMNL